jgi:uncharacterized glyoxalase superfamily protein PhnB
MSADRSSSFVAVGLAVSLSVGDLGLSIGWYRDVLGFTVDREFEHQENRFAARLSAGEVKILLTQDDGMKGTGRSKGEGFSLQFTTEQDVDALAGQAKAHGAALDLEPSDSMGARVFRLRDPDGFRLVISSKRQ